MGAGTRGHYTGAAARLPGRTTSLPAVRRLRRPTAVAALIVLLALLAGILVIVATDAGVDALAPAVVFGVAVAVVVSLLLPGGAESR